MNIVFFGASVTQQRHGYVDSFRKYSKKNRVKKCGYGGMHLCNAGICFIDNIVKLKPNICFVDWFSTGYNNEDSEACIYINTIAKKLIDIKCRVIFLFFPFQNDDKKSFFYKNIKNYLTSKKMEFISIDEQIDNNEYNYILRDSIHTTVLGGKIYAEIIKNYLLDKASYNFSPKLDYTKYSNIKRKKIQRVFKNKCSLYSKEGCHVIGVFHIVGPHSGVLEIENDGNISYKENVWDSWCYYLRNTFSLKMLIKGEVDINITNEVLDTTMCLKSHVLDTKKMLVFNSIFYIGTDLEIIDKGSYTGYWLMYTKMIECFLVHGFRSNFQLLKESIGKTIFKKH